MFNIKEYIQRNKQLAARLPWGLFVAPGVIQNKNGSLQTTYKYRGDDPLVMTDSRNSAIISQINNAFRRLGTGWAIFTEEQKRQADDYPASDWPNRIARLIEQEKIVSFKQEKHYEIAQYMTFVYLPPSELSQKIEDRFTDNEPNERNYNETINKFINDVTATVQILSSLLPEIHHLNDDETCTYLHSCISTKQHKVKAPTAPAFLDYLLPDEPVTGGLNPKIGDHHLGVVSLKDYPDTTKPNILAGISKMPFEYRWVSRFICLSKDDAVNEFNKYSRDWASKRIALKDFISNIFMKNDGNGEIHEDSIAVQRAKECDEAAHVIQAGHVSGGYFTQAIIIWDTSEQAVQHKIGQIEGVINSAMYVSIREKANAMAAWFGSLPGHCNANVRRPLITSLPYAHMIPSASTWTGPEKNNHLNGPPLFIANTDSHDPFRFSTHIEDVGNMAILGPMGTGKSTLLNYVATNYQKYPGAQVFYFDYHYSAYVNTIINGGVHYSIGEDQGVTFQPLRDIDSDQERAWAYSWLTHLLKTEKVSINPVIKKELWGALTNLAKAAAPENRTMTALTTLVQNREIKEALQEYTYKGPYGLLFDSNVDYFASDTRWLTFEMSHLMEDMPGAVNPLMSYLMHKIDKAMTGRPVLIPQDECFIFMENDVYGGQLKKWAKTIRKHNGAIILATTSLADIRENENASSLIDSITTKVFLPNAEILDESNHKLYQGFGLNDKQIKILSEAQYKREYYIKTKLGCRKIDLGLGELALAVCGSSSKQDILFMKELCETYANRERIRQRFFEFKGVSYEPNIDDLNDDTDNFSNRPGEASLLSSGTTGC